MKYVFLLSLIIISITISFQVFITKDTVDPSILDASKTCLELLNISDPDSQTLIISNELDISNSYEKIWNAWSMVNKWSSWSKIYTSTTWTADSQWTESTQFEAIMNLGFPLHEYKTLFTINHVISGEQATWSNIDANFSVCQTFFITPGESLNQSKITHLLILRSIIIPFLKPIIKDTLTNRMQLSDEVFSSHITSLQQ